MPLFLKHRLMSDDYQRIELITGRFAGGVGSGNRRCNEHDFVRPHCPRCIINRLGPNPIFFGVGNEGHICRACWDKDRAKDTRK